MFFSTLVLIITAIFFPPLAVFFMTGCSCDLLLNIFLTILGFIPGHIHAFYIIFKKVEAENKSEINTARYTGAVGHYEPIRANPPLKVVPAPVVVQQPQPQPQMPTA